MINAKSGSGNTVHLRQLPGPVCRVIHLLADKELTDNQENMNSTVLPYVRARKTVSARRYDKSPSSSGA